MSPRVVVNIPAVVSHGHGIHVDVRLHDLSVSGTGFQCSTAQRDLITPRGCLLKEGKPIEVIVSFRLSADTGTVEDLTAKCAIVYSRRLAVDRCQVGMRFVEMTDDSREQLRRFIVARIKSGAACRRNGT